MTHSRSARPTHSITSSALMRRAGGISRPSAFAVLRLIANSNLCGLLYRKFGRCCTFQNLVNLTGGAPE